jgi:hypothetical protein
MIRCTIKPLETLFSTLVIIFVHYVAKHLRHQDTKMNINQKVTRFALCLGAVVAIGYGLSGLGFKWLTFRAVSNIFTLISQTDTRNDFLL